MHYRLIFIGGGTAALAGISEALELGAERIAYIEERPDIGGVCAIDGCVPMHAMLAGANAFQSCQKADEFGFTFQPCGVNFTEFMQRVRAITEQGLSDPFSDEEKVTLYSGKASFLSPYDLKILCPNGKEHIISGEQIVIATGATPTVPDIPGLKDIKYWQYHHVTHAETLPASLVIIGGGRIGTEFAQLLHRLGSQIILIESNAQLLFREDPDASAGVRQLLEQEGIQVYTGSEIVQIEQEGLFCKRVSFLHGHQELKTVEVDEVLLATGREARIDELNLGKAGIESNANGILVNERCRTSVPHIWAVGDVVGPYRFTHVANYQAVTAVQNILCYRDQVLNYDTMPFAYYYEPPFARVGLTEVQAREKYQTVVVLKRGLESVSINRIERDTWGFCKILIDGETDQILGAHVISPGADDSIHIIAMAMHAGITATKATQLVYAYPTKAQIIQKTLELYRHVRAEAAQKKTIITKTAG